MSKNIRVIYLYIVSFITLGMIVVGSIYFVNSISSYCFPVVSSYYSYKDDIDFMYNDKYIDSVKSEKRGALRNVISSIAIVGVSAPIYIYHSKKAMNEKLS